MSRFGESNKQLEELRHTDLFLDGISQGPRVRHHSWKSFRLIGILAISDDWSSFSLDGHRNDPGNMKTLGIVSNINETFRYCDLNIM